MPKPVLHRLVESLEVRAPLDAADRAAILSLPHDVRILRTGAFLTRAGQNQSCCWLLTEGVACRHKIVADGGRQIVGLHLPGSLLDFQAPVVGSSDDNVQALTVVEAACIPVAAFEATTAARPSLLRALLAEAMVEASIFREWIANIGRRDARTRLAHLLCELALRQQMTGLTREAGSFHLPMTQEQIADVLGLTAVHVNRTLQLLEAGGLIRRAKRRVLILDWLGLQQAGDFRPAYLHLPERRLESAA